MSVSADEVNAFLDGVFPGTGNRCVEIGEGYAVAEFRVEPDPLRPGGYVSGPTQFGVADAALWYALFGTVTWHFTVTCSSCERFFDRLRAPAPAP